MSSQTPLSVTWPLRCEAFPQPLFPPFLPASSAFQNILCYLASPPPHSLPRPMPCSPDPSCLPAPETDTPARTHTARLLREVGTVHRSLLPHTGTSTTEPQPTHRHAHTHTQAPQSHTRDTHTHTLHTVYTHTAHGVGETEKHHRATPQTHTDTHSSHTHGRGEGGQGLEARIPGWRGRA